MSENIVDANNQVGENRQNGRITKSPINPNLTRLVASGAITGGKAFRQQVVAQYKHPYRAVAPEIGIDPEIVLRVCSHIEEVDKGNNWGWLVVLLGIPVMAIPVIGWIIGLLMIWGGAKMINAEDNIQKKYIELFRAANYNPATIKSTFSKADSSLLNRIPKANQNLIVYGGFQPFVGAGFPLNNWSFPIDIGRWHNDEGVLIEPESFELSELYEAVIAKMDELHFDNIDVRDYLFAFGSDVRNQQEILESPLSYPKQEINEASVKQAMNRSDTTMRYYKWISLYDWDGEIVLSFFLRFSKRGSRNLFVEFSTYILMPLREAFHEVDHEPEKAGCFNFGANAAANARKAQQRAVQNAALQAFSFLTPQGLKELAKEVSGNSRYNYGVTSSIREMASANHFARYFQYMDKEMYVKIIDKTVLQAIEGFLEAHDVNMTAFRDYKSVVINHGIMGEVNAENLAVGEGSQANVLERVQQQLTGQNKQNNKKD
jgi:hypothetical protein